METAEESDKTKDASNSRKDRLRKELDSLHREMEIAEYVTETGQRRRIAPRKTQLLRTKKRKLLEKVDAEQHAISVVEDEGAKRLRGAKAAMEDNVIQASLIFGGEDEAEETDYGKSDIEGVESADEVDIGEEGGRYEMYDDGAALEEDDVDDAEAEIVDDPASTPSTRSVRFRESSVAAASGKPEEVDIPKSGRKRRRLIYRLRSFKSYRMAQRHGDALGAHARGQPKVAIEKLKEVASDAPAAAQIYSSLGLVYEDMLNDTTGSSRTLDEPGNDNDQQEDQDETNVEDGSIEQKINIAKKAYGSYHVAAVLCKKDFTLWVRAGDTAMQIADLCSEAMTSSSTPDYAIEEYRREKKRWIEEAKKDFTSADNLKPPGIDVAAKLAVSHMELGNLSEAITILTDLKNRKLSATEASEQSYRIWLLYADLMLRIGHECTQWNRGIEKNENYMFRRWLRKYSESFDWQERRLQALCLALEAAAGSKSCAHVIEWSKTRAKNAESVGPSVSANDRWHMDSNKTLDAAESTTKKNHDSPKTKSGALEMDGEGNDDETDGRGSDRATEPDSVANDAGTANINDADGVDIGQEDSVSSRLSDNATPTEMEDVSAFIKPSAGRRQDSMSELKEKFEKEKQRLLSENKSNLAAFDEDTQKMNLEPGSETAKARHEARESLVKAQRAAIVKLVGEFHQNQASNTAKNLEQEENPSHTTTALHPISASCATVCSIASELIKHCLGLELYDGGRLVGEAVSLYLKERASMHQERVAAQDAFTLRQQSTDESVLLHFEPYDDIAEERNDSDEESVTTFLSDEEEIAATDGRLLKSLKTGSLPPELRVLYSLSLIGEGGRDYVASKTIESLNELEPESPSWLSKDVVDSSVTTDSTWQMFRCAMVEPLERTAAFAFLSDLLLKTGKEQEWSSRLEPMFQQHMNYLEEQGLIDKLFAPDSHHSYSASLKKNNVLKVVLAAIRITLCHAESYIQEMEMQMTRTGGEKHGHIDQAQNAMKLASSALSTAAKFQRSLWNVGSDGSIPSRCTEILHILSRSFDVMLRAAEATGQISAAQFTLDLLAEMKPIVSLLSNVDVPDFDGTDEFDPLLAAESWPEFPLPNHWQNFSQEAISKRAYNLCVACNVSRFSGWENDEFNLDLLKRRGTNKYFGVNISGNRVLGHVTNEVEVGLTQAWKRIGNLMPWALSFDFEEGLSAVKNAEWYKTAKAKMDSGIGQSTVASHGEENGIKILLTFSNLCLLIAEASSSNATADALVKTALSVVLPVTQFCLEQHLWDSPLGTAAAGPSCGNAWKHFSGADAKNRESIDNGEEPYCGPLRVRKSQPKAPWKRQQGNQQSEEPLLVKKFVRLPASFLLKEWKQDTIADERATSSLDSAQQAMQKVDSAVRRLRSCFTIGALERASLHVAAAMLELVARGEYCNNPFICLQQAAIFASQGAKGGSNDERFKEALPDEHECTPLAALVIIGRADCLQAIDFPSEAMFLCSYAARVCRLHRDRQRTDMPWTSQWRVIGISAHNVRVAIDSTVCGLVHRDDSRKVQVELWERDVLEELDRGKADAIALRRSLLDKEMADNVNTPHAGSTLGQALDENYRPDNLTDNIVDVDLGGGELPGSEILVKSDDDEGSNDISIVAV